MDSNIFLLKLKENPRPVIVDIWAPWCAPCRAMEPALKQAAHTYENRVDVWKINADEAPDVIRSLKVMGIPTIIGFSQGQEILRKTGAQSAESLDILFDAVLHRRSGVILPPAPADRWIRSLIGFILLLVGLSSGPSLIVVFAGSVLLFSAFYDRCPLFRAVAPRLASLLKKPFKTT